MAVSILAIPNGSLYKATVGLMAKCGISLKRVGREFLVETKIGEIFGKAFILRPQDIPSAVVRGFADAGICGLDCVVEAGLELSLAKIVELDYAKVSREPARVVLFGKTDEFVDAEDVTVASEYPNIARTVFEKAQVDFSYGTTEAKVARGMYQYGIGITETGKSLADSNLVIVRTLLSSPIVLVARKESPKYKFFGELLKGTLAAEKLCLIKMNVARKNRKKVIKVLPALKSPTESSLADGSLAIETIIPKSEIVYLVDMLRSAGATGILIQDVGIVLR
jgi:ATP phosphoribosyltransferase